MTVGREPDSRGGVAAGQAALAVLVTAGVGVAALLLRHGGGPGKGSGPLGGHGAVVVLLALAWAAGGLALSGRYRRQVRYDQELSAVEQRLTDTVRYALVVLALAVPAMVVGLHRFAGGGAAPRADSPRVRPDLQLPTPVPTSRRPTHAAHPSHLKLPPHLLFGLGVALLAALGAVAAVYLWRLLRPAPEPPPEGTYGTVDGEQRRLAEAVDSGRRALLGGDDARAAVIACYLAMEQSLAASGVARKASDSPHDLLARATEGGLLTGTGAAVLTDLFREARYSTHPMDAGHRDRAAAALAEIAAGLDAAHPDAAQTPGRTAAEAAS